MAKKTSERLIFTSDVTDYDFEQAKKDLIERDGLDEEQAKEVTDEQVWQSIYDDVEFSYDCERTNLNKLLDNNIVCIASLGLWHGRVSGYRMLKNNLNSILDVAQGDYYRVTYTPRGVYAKDPHHDGTNYYEFREVKEGVDIDTFLEKIYNGTMTSRDKTRYTKSLAPVVKEIYGF